MSLSLLTFKVNENSSLIVLSSPRTRTRTSFVSLSFSSLLSNVILVRSDLIIDKSFILPSSSFFLNNEVNDNTVIQI